MKKLGILVSLSICMSFSELKAENVERIDLVKKVQWCAGYKDSKKHDECMNKGQVMMNNSAKLTNAFKKMTQDCKDSESNENCTKRTGSYVQTINNLVEKLVSCGKYKDSTKYDECIGMKKIVKEDPKDLPEKNSSLSHCEVVTEDYAICGGIKYVRSKEAFEAFRRPKINIQEDEPNHQNVPNSAKQK